MPPLSQPKSNSRSLLTILAVIVFVTAMVLVILQNLGPVGGSGKIIRGYDDGYADGFRAARDQAGAPSPKETSFLSGNVTAVRSDSVSFTIKGFVFDERVDGISLSRTAHVTNQTQIVLAEDRNSDEIQEEQKAFQRALANLETGKAPPTPPSPFKEIAISLSEIHEGDIVAVQADAGLNIIPLSSFDAVKIIVRRAAVAPQVPAASADTNTAVPPPVAPPTN